MLLAVLAVSLLFALKQSLVLFAVLAANGVVFSIDGKLCYLQY